MDLKRVKIAYHDHGKKMWLIRASGGKYINHFRQSGIVTIGHLDDIYDHREVGVEDIPTQEKIEQILLRNPDYSKPINSTSKRRKLSQSGTSKLQQIAAFKNIKKGDLIVSVDADYLMIGICNEDSPYLDGDPVKIAVPEGQQRNRKEYPSLKQRMRRSVTWGPSLSRYRLPSAIKKTFQGRRTVISLDKHWDKFLHLIYPFFVDDDNLYISNRIGTNAPINNLIISGFLQNVALTQIIAESFVEKEKIDLDYLYEVLSLGIDLAGLDSTSKAEFMSPGDIWSRIPLNNVSDKASYIIGCVLVSLILSGHTSIAELIDEAGVSTATQKYVAPTSMADDIFTPPKKKKRQGAIVAEIKSQAAVLNALKEQRKSSLINKKLTLSLPNVDTQGLESIEHGIPVAKVVSDAQ
ncbi:hypothetical protein K7H92_21035 [Pseudomonas stutzeri]|nr:hypothetical protein [Stutzerimonas stutzeri]